MSTAARYEENDLSDADPKASLVRSLRTPLDALRASLEALGGDSDPDESSSRPHIILGALEELSRIARCVDELVDFSSAQPPRPLRCSTEEILVAARNQVASSQRERVVLARVGNPAPLYVDGPLLISSLGRLIENALEASADEVLLSVRQDDLRTTFCVADHDPFCRFSLDEANRAFATRKSDHLGLGLTLAKRDVESMGGTLSGQRSAHGDTLIQVQLPRTAEPAPALPGAQANQGDHAA